MNRYKCRISDRSGKITEIEKNAPDEKTLIKLINDDQVFLISYSEMNGSGNKRFFNRKIIIDYTDTMALMLQSGLSVKDSLKVASSSFGDKKTGELVAVLSDFLNKGVSYPDALDQLSADFNPLYRGMVRIGDQTGSLDKIYGKLSQYLGDEKKMREKVLGALLYPLLVIFVLFIAMIAVFFFVFPRIRQTFTDDSLSVIFDRFQIMMYVTLIPSVMFILFLLFLFFASRGSRALKLIAHRIFLKLPLLGPINLLRSSLNTMFSLEVLSDSGFPIEAALKESSSVLNNTLLKEAVIRIRKAIIGGDKLSEAFRRETVFPNRISVWIGIGEASGDVSKVFSQLRSYFQGELDKLTSRIMLLIEPVLIVLVGVFMILFVILFVVPIFGIFGAIL